MEFYIAILQLINELTTEEKRVEFLNKIGKIDDEELIDLVEEEISLEDIEYESMAA